MLSVFKIQIVLSSLGQISLIQIVSYKVGEKFFRLQSVRGAFLLNVKRVYSDQAYRRLISKCHDELINFINSFSRIVSGHGEYNTKAIQY